MSVPEQDKSNKQKDNLMSEILLEDGFKIAKMKTLPIYDRYMKFNPKKAQNILECGSSLWFNLMEHRESKEQKLTLQNMYTCKDRFCSFCNWRRQMKYKKLIYMYLKALHTQKNLRYIFLTLTVKNPHISDLRATIELMNKAFERMSRSVRFKNSILGFLRVLEFTVQKTNANMMHPHFHILLAVEPRYFVDERYINQKEWAEMWAKALKADYVPSVDIRIVKPSSKMLADDGTRKNGTAVVAEMCKYPLKDTDLSRLSDDNFQKLVTQLKGVRNINAGGILKNILKRVKEIDEDLVHLNEEQRDELWILLERVLYQFKTREGKLDYYKKNFRKK